MENARLQTYRKETHLHPLICVPHTECFRKISPKFVTVFEEKNCGAKCGDGRELSVVNATVLLEVTLL